MRHVIQRVGRATAAPEPRIQVVPSQMGRAAQAAGLANVAIIEADHPKTGVHQPVHQRWRPPRQLLAQAVDQQYRRRVRRSQRLVGERDRADAGKVDVIAHGA
ncbi:hypothetical protein D3C76_1298610 [compost metagenome]